MERQDQTVFGFFLFLGQVEVKGQMTHGVHLMFVRIEGLRLKGGCPLETHGEVRQDGEPLSLMEWAMSSFLTQDVGGQGLAHSTTQSHLRLGKAAQCSHKTWAVELFMQEAQNSYLLGGGVITRAGILMAERMKGLADCGTGEVKK